MSETYPIRVLHRGMSYNKGGIETYLINYYRHMDRNLVQFDFIVPVGMNIAYEDEIKALGGNIYKEIVGIKASPIRGLVYDRIFFKKHPEISILHINDCSAANLRLMKTAKKCGIATRILHSHNNDYLRPLQKRQLLIEKYNKRHLLKIATDLLACSKDAGKFMFGNLPFQVVKNAIDINRYIFCEEKRRKVRKELNIEAGQYVIGCVARFDYQKNHDRLLEMFSAYKKLNPTSILVLVGDGPLKKSIESRIHELNLEEYVILLGVRDDVPDLLSAFDLFMLPSRSEGLGIVLIEAQINGLQCLVSDNVPAESNILDKVTYLSLEEENSTWAQKVCEIKSLGDAERTVDLKVVREAGYDIEVESKKLQNFYLEKARLNLRGL